MLYTDFDDLDKGLSSLDPLDAAALAAMPVIDTIARIQQCASRHPLEGDWRRIFENAISRLVVDLDRLNRCLQNTDAWDRLCMANPYPVVVGDTVAENFAEAAYNVGRKLLETLEIYTDPITVMNATLGSGASDVDIDMDLVGERWELISESLIDSSIDCNRLRVDIRKEYQRAADKQLSKLEEGDDWVTMTTADMAKHLRVSQKTVTRRIETGVIPATKIEGTPAYRVRLADIEKLVY